ncbi:hypothetical protein [uncultured Sphingomonas sp.]|uniref:hypothetical protein n=1 Tax=uncultured Sphingomonas sp. TaxID=158754 RepID=UPI0025F08C5C|nr:hypothetical protein [uncultured Sphingomonas sp.]
MYSIKIDKANSLVNVALTGMMGLPEVAAYIAELKRQFVAQRLHDYAMVIDVTDMPIQSQDTITAMGEHMASMPKARALAVVTGRSLARMQVRRLFKQPYCRVTSTVAEGVSWVLRGVEPTTQ